MWARKIAKHLAGLVLMVLLGGIAAATLVRMAPGFGVDEQEFDPRLSEASIQALRDARAANQNLGHFYIAYLRGLAHGEFGTSSTLKRPVRELIAERGLTTIELAGWGLIGGWILGLGLAVAGSEWRRVRFDFASISLSAVFLSLPAALIGLLVLFTRVPWWWAISLVIFPKIFTYARNLLEKVSAEPHVLLARAKGLGKARILVWHILPAMAPEMLALGGVSVSLAFSTAIPVEAICDVPGAGQLAWQAALGRDLPVLVTLTLLLALITRVANIASDVAISALGREAA